MRCGREDATFGPDEAQAAPKRPRRVVEEVLPGHRAWMPDKPEPPPKVSISPDYGLEMRRFELARFSGKCAWRSDGAPYSNVGARRKRPRAGPNEARRGQTNPEKAERGFEGARRGPEDAPDPRRAETWSRTRP